MPKKSAMADQVQLDFAFFQYLMEFYQSNRGMIRSYYRAPSKVFLDYNDPDKNPDAYLRTPQFQALEIYIFLKEYLKNAPIHRVFEDWRKKQGKFTQRKEAGLSTDTQIVLFDTLNETTYKSIFAMMRKFSRIYPNYIFALTMGIGKTILMGTCIFYEFILASKFPDDELYCQNALIFAPDKTVLESLREIITFDFKKVIPPEYANWINSHIRFHFLDEAGLTLNTLDGSCYNVIIANTQKIILKKQHKEKSLGERLFEEKKQTTKASTVYDEIADLYEEDSPEDEKELLMNQRFLKLCRLPRLGIYVDEAHHSFGQQLAKDMGLKTAKTSLRTTIDELALNLQKGGTKVVACYNYTGTPYIGNQILPEVVYAYGLHDAINNKYLKKVLKHGYTNPRTDDFINIVIRDFWKKYGEQRREGMLPKLAIFASTIDELGQNLRPAVENVLSEIGISLDKILVNVGDPKITSSDDIREFNRLDTSQSEKQFILLVNKGKEGWNCRSLFGVAMYRSPDSRVFVLQAAMRCLRSIGDVQETANIYLSEENVEILDDELQQNFRINIEQLQGAGSKHKSYEIRIVPPKIELQFKRIRRIYELERTQLSDGIDLELEKIDIEKYRLVHIQREGLEHKNSDSDIVKQEDLTYLKKQRLFSPLTLIAEISRYLNRPCLEIANILDASQQGMDKIIRAVNEYNEILYDEIIPRLFGSLYHLEPHEETEEDTIQLVKEPTGGFYRVNAAPEYTAELATAFWQRFKNKSFHLDKYCFDSKAEFTVFSSIVNSNRIKKVYFTGMLTHGQTDFHVHYVDPETHMVRTYYPDFLIERLDGSWLIVEVKGDDQFEDPVVRAKKEYAERLAMANNMSYEMIRASEAANARYRLNLI